MNTNPPGASHALHRLLFFRALLELRSQGHEYQNKVVFHLADLFHTVVLEMEKAARGECSYDDVLRSLEERARAQGCESWLDAARQSLRARGLSR